MERPTVAAGTTGNGAFVASFATEERRSSVVPVGAGWYSVCTPHPPLDRNDASLASMEINRRQLLGLINGPFADTREMHNVHTMFRR